MDLYPGGNSSGVYGVTNGWWIPYSPATVKNIQGRAADDKGDPVAKSNKLKVIDFI